MKVLSVCSGGGGIDEGLKQAGIKTTLAIDNNKDCINTMKRNHDCETITGSILQYEYSFDNFDLVVGGPPCPEFSNAKTNKTYDDTLVRCFFRIVGRTKCKYHLMENVPGVINVCKKKNYLIDMADYGLAQNRVRRFYTNLELPKKTHSSYPSNDLFGNKIKKWVSVKDALDIKDWKWMNKTSFRGQNKKMLSQSINNPSPTIVNANQYQLTDEPIYSTFYHKYKQKSTRIELVTLDQRQILQGFSPDYKFSGAPHSRRSQICNAVPPPIVKQFFESSMN